MWKITSILGTNSPFPAKTVPEQAMCCCSSTGTYGKPLGRMKATDTPAVMGWGLSVAGQELEQGPMRGTSAPITAPALLARVVKVR